MGFLARLLGAVPKEERNGIRLDEPDPWRVSPTKDVERFLRALPSLVPDGSIAYFEDTAESHVAEYLRQVSIPGEAQLAVGTLWPKPDIYHVPVTVDSMQALATFLEEHPAGVLFCSHCHAYRNGLVLVQWHDAFIDDPIYISRTIGPEVVSAFAQTLGSKCEAGWG